MPYSFPPIPARKGPATHYHVNPDGTRGAETTPCTEIGSVIFDDGEAHDEYGFDVWDLRAQVQDLSRALDQALAGQEEA